MSADPTFTRRCARGTSPVEAALEGAVREGLLPAGARVLVAASGGPDSTALLHALARRAASLGLGEVTAGHVDHGLRSDSTDDAAHVERLASDLNVECRVARVTVGREGGVQAAARRARYAALEELRVELGADLVATAHTADDQAETVVLRMARGTGPGGLKGIAPRRGRVVRPLLDCTRADLAEYCRAAGAEARDDPSNHSDVYRRVRVRRQVLPLLADALNPEIVPALARLARLARDEDRLLASLAEGLRSRAAEGGAGLAVRVLAEADPALGRRVLAAAWREASGAAVAPVEASHVQRLLERVRRNESVEETLPGGVTACVSCGRLAFTRGRWPSIATLTIDGPGTWLIPEADLRMEVLAASGPAAGADPKAPPQVLRLPDGVGPPLTVRAWRAGDRLGAGGPKVKDLLARARVPRFARGRVPLLVQGPPEAAGQVLWVVGVRAALPEGAPGSGLQVRFLESGL